MNGDIIRDGMLNYTMLLLLAIRYLFYILVVVNRKLKHLNTKSRRRNDKVEVIKDLKVDVHVDICLCCLFKG